jgi:outer membrane receptor protein involved in Fe transport
MSINHSLSAVARKRVFPHPSFATKTPLSRAIRLALSTGALTAGMSAMSPVSAQDEPVDRFTRPTDEVTVTGSRIQRQDYEATSPVYTIDKSALIDAGTLNVEQVLNELPQLVPSLTTTSNNPGQGGQAIVDLRGLGTSRTLVLVDGLRMQPASTAGEADLNIIPAALIQSIEVMTGGGSATYGSDAIAGVVNIKLRRDFEGVEVGMTTGLSSESDGRTKSASVIFGGNFDDDRGNAVLSMSWDEREGIFAGARDFSAVALGPDLRPLGSTTIPSGYYEFAGTNAPTQAVMDSVFAQFGAPAGTVPNSSWVGFNPNGSIFSRDNTVNFQGDRSDPGFNPANYTYNYSPVNYLQLPLERHQLYAFGHYNLAEDIEIYSNLSYTTYSAEVELASTPLATGTGSSMPMSNPFIPADLRTILNSRPTPGANFTFSKRFTDVGPRNGTNEFDIASITVGGRGDFLVADKDWSWDVAGTWGRTNRTESQSGNVSRSRINTVYNNPNGLAGCTGFNPFGEGNINAACARAISIQAQNITVLTTQGLFASVTGALANLPAGSVEMAAGLETRRNVGKFKPDQFLASGDVVGFNALQPIAGEIEVDEAFVEVSVPLLADKTGVNYLGLDLGYRRSDYSTAGEIDTSMAGIEYQPIETLKFRGSYQRATRAPNIFELYRPRTENFPPVTDPCWNGSAERTGPNGAQVDALCQAQGAPANFPQGNSQVRALTGGNPDVGPESADTYTFGAVWQPAGVGEGQFRMAVDWFRYELEDVIGAVGAASIVSRCYNAQGANPTYSLGNIWCTLFTRGPTGSATDVMSNDQNLGKRNVDGIDLQFDYRLPAGPGTVNLSLAATHLLKWQQQEDPAAPLTNQEGTIGIEFAETFPEWKGVLGLGYALDRFDIRWTIRYVDAMPSVEADAPRSPGRGVQPYTPSYSNHRLTGTWAPNEQLSLMIGIDNVTDEVPPIYTTSSRSGVQANTDPSTFDVRGQRYFMSLSYLF